MASSDMAGIDPWTFRTSSYLDPWLSEALSRDNKTLSAALTKSLFSDDLSSSDFLLPDPFPPLLAQEESAPITPAVSNVSGGSDPEFALPVSQRRSRSIAVSAASGKVKKRKPRASKRSQTTFITADPAEFRQMVQQVTGVRFPGSSSSQLSAATSSLLKPAPQRSGGLVAGGCLPTLDTSAFLLDLSQQQQQSHNQQLEAHTGAASLDGVAMPYMAADGGCCGGGGGLGLESFACFPTLESWNAM